MLRLEPDHTSRFVRLRPSDARGRTRDTDGRTRAAGIPRGELDARDLRSQYRDPRIGRLDLKAARRALDLPGALFENGLNISGAMQNTHDLDRAGLRTVNHEVRVDGPESNRL